MIKKGAYLHFAMSAILPSYATELH